MARLQPGAGLFEGLGLDGDEATGANIVKVALEAPLEQIAVNAGLEGVSWWRRAATSPRARASTPPRPGAYSRTTRSNQADPSRRHVVAFEVGV
ncbi:hypothetical protein GCM10023320_81720 [Pseudonocardia adelaidensis]|uniref:TCP-1/cpn60 chaperonin family protein n=1 Tax=Pseudonocardia adelaidensis TaxID=648754 RepID=A0ABP9P7U7_9PSEU